MVSGAIRRMQIGAAVICVVAALLPPVDLFAALGWLFAAFYSWETAQAEKGEREARARYGWPL